MAFSKRRLIGALIIIVLLFVFSLIPSNDERTYCIISSIVVIISLACLWRSFGTFNGALIYYACLAFMHCGQIIMIALNLPFPSVLRSSIVLGFTTENEFVAIKFTTISCLVCSLILYIFSNSKEEKKVNNQPLQINGYELTQIGWAIYIIILALSITSDITKAIAVNKIGYLLGFRQTNGILYYADMLLPLFTFFTLSIYRNNVKINKIVFLIMIFKSGFSAFFVGTRSTAVLSILMVAYAIYRLSERSENKRWIKKTCIILFLAGIIALPLSGLLRTKDVNGIVDFITNYNPISYSLTEFGGSINNVKQSSQFFYDKEISVVEFYKSFLTILPLSTIVFPNVVGTYGNAYANYINSRVGVFEGGGGAGGSVLGEGVFWFGPGIGGYVYIVIITLIVIWCFKKLNNNRSKNRLLFDPLVMFLLYELFYQIRGTIQSVQTGIKLGVYFYIIFICFRSILYKETFSTISKDTYTSG